MLFIIIIIFALMLIITANILVIRNELRKIRGSVNSVVNYLYDEQKEELTYGQ